MANLLNPIAPAQSCKSRHLLRHLLREATYLPDPVAREYIHRHILRRFRDYYQNPLYEGHVEPPHNKRLKSVRENARRALSLLIRANMGQYESLQRVLFLAYGRIGRRRHELLSEL